jgi:hypothetical protein
MFLDNIIRDLFPEFFGRQRKKVRKKGNPPLGVFLGRIYNSYIGKPDNDYSGKNPKQSSKNPADMVKLLQPGSSRPRCFIKPKNTMRIIIRRIRCAISSTALTAAGTGI